MAYMVPKLSMVVKRGFEGLFTRTKFGTAHIPKFLDFVTEEDEKI